MKKLFALIFLCAATNGAAQSQISAAWAPGDSRRGEALFRDRGCIGCHSFRGQGAGTAPDLSRRSLRSYSPEAFSALMWNHAPAMWAAMQKKGMAVPQLSQRDSADLFAYFYAIRYFDEPADMTRARALFSAKHCGNCHMLRRSDAKAGAGPTVGPVLAESNTARDPIGWAREMWNHAPKMYGKMREKGVSWPRMTSQEMSELLSFLQALPETRTAAKTFAPSDARKGSELFHYKGCNNCHTVGTEEPRKINLLAAGRARGSMAEIAASMWNHAPLMYRRSQTDKVAMPVFAGEEMNDLVAYLFWSGFFQSTGNSGRGRRVFTAKNCASCHTPNGAAPDLAQYRGQVSPVFMTAALWTHGPQMLQARRQKGLGWPNFTGPEMADLIAYLNAGAAAKQVRPASGM